jgi:DNA modification methylase
MKQIINCDCTDWLYSNPEPVHMLFGDPFDGIGLKYKGFSDKVTPKQYESLLMCLLRQGSAVSNVIWLSVNVVWADLLGKVTWQFRKESDWEFKPCVQVFTFGQHRQTDLGNNHRLLYRYKRKGAPLYPDAVRVPSWRQLNGDKRADPRGRVPGDVFDFPRVTGNSHQRRDFSPTQLHEGLYERCIKLCCPRGVTIVDLFAGSGTLGRVADRCGVNVLMIEKSRETCDNILKDQPDVVEVAL